MNEQTTTASTPRCPTAETSSGRIKAGCGSTNVSTLHDRSGLAQCNDCGHWFRSGTHATPHGTEEVISALRAVVDPKNAGHVLSSSLAGDAVRALAAVMLSSWEDALRDGNQSNLLIDFERIVGEVQTLRNCYAALLPQANIGTAALPNYLAGAELSEIVASLDGLTQPISPESVSNDYPTRALYMAEIALGERRPFPVG